MSKKIVFLVLAIILIFGGLFGTKFIQINNAMSSRKPPPPPVVTTVTVATQQWGNTLSTVGTINPVLGVILSNEIAGIVSALPVESGQHVNKGDVLIELDTSTDQARLNGLVSSEKLALIKFNRLAKLLKSNTTSRSSYDEARAQLDVAKAAVVEQQSIINKKKIRAPFSGKLGIRQVSLGQYLDKGTQIYPLVSLATTIADFSFPERDFAKLKEHQPVKIQVQAYPNETFEGVIQAINPGIHEETRTIAVRAVVNNPNEKLRAGMFADVSVVVSAPKPVLTLPETTVLYNTYGENVYLVKQKDNKKIAVLQVIKTGKHRHGHVEITHGLTLGDTVVDEGHVKLRNGQNITISNHN
ncbi:MAG: efflux transporter periplasmic adaptor subunit [Piscirickettsiaceae bacterium]|nr:MAG: efflux transporter periplasmic adaptor subunit [Piscirickettsiaceae bacterium]PCI70298.1 MAG: efflux transporter periplasmic adaptor subunit [Piscirickettsiaceae bacterium]